MEDPRCSISAKAATNTDYLTHTLKRLRAQAHKHTTTLGLQEVTPLASIIHDKRRTPDGKLITGLPDSVWCEPATQALRKAGVTFRRDVDGNNDSRWALRRADLETIFS